MANAIHNNKDKRLRVDTINSTQTIPIHKKDLVSIQYKPFIAQQIIGSKCSACRGAFLECGVHRTYLGAAYIGTTLSTLKNY